MIDAQITALALEAKTRKETSKKLSALRKDGNIPGVVYGHGRPTVPVAIPYSVFERIYQKAGESSLVDLRIDDHAPVKVLIQDIQTDPVNGKYLHVDFHEVKLTEKLSTDITLRFIGEAKAVKELGGVLVKTVDHLRVECLAKDLVHEIDVDISSLQGFDDAIRIRDIQLPPGISIKVSEDEVIVTVQPPRSEEEIKALEETPAAEVGEVEVVEKGKKKEEGEEGETAEGAAQPAAEPKQEKK